MLLTTGFEPPWVGTGAVWLLSLADPGRPVERMAAPGNFSDVALGGELAVAVGSCVPAETACLATFDVPDDHTITVSGRVALDRIGWRNDLACPPAVAVQAGWAYAIFRVDDAQATLVTVDITDPSQPRVARRDRLAVACPTDLTALSDGRLLVSGQEQTQLAVDPLSGVVLTDRFPVAGRAAVADGVAYVAGGESGIWRIALDQP